MSEVIRVNSRGTLTLPRLLRQRLGIEGNGQLIVEETPEGILLRPAVTLPLEIYNKKRLAEFARNNDAALAVHQRQKIDQAKPRKLSFKSLTATEREQREKIMLDELRKVMKVRATD